MRMVVLGFSFSTDVPQKGMEKLLQEYPKNKVHTLKGDSFLQENVVEACL